MSVSYLLVLTCDWNFNCDNVQSDGLLAVSDMLDFQFPSRLVSVEIFCLPSVNIQFPSVIIIFIWRCTMMVVWRVVYDFYIYSVKFIFVLLFESLLVWGCHYLYTKFGVQVMFRLDFVFFSGGQNVYMFFLLPMICVCLCFLVEISYLLSENDWTMRIYLTKCDPYLRKVFFDFEFWFRIQSVYVCIDVLFITTSIQT